MKVLIACEFSGVVRDAFLKGGHDAISCDLQPTERHGPHYKGDVRDILYSERWDLMIAHPPCTDLAVSGARWFKNKLEKQKEALFFVTELLNAPILHIAIENPISLISTKIRQPDQIINPWQFGESYSKNTCLWLKNLPLLTPTRIVERGEFHITKSGKKIPKWYNIPPCEERAKARSRTFPGIAAAMAEQWGDCKTYPVQFSLSRWS